MVMQIMGSSVGAEPAVPTNPCGINAGPHFAFLSFHTAQPTSTLSKISQSEMTAGGAPCFTRRLRLPTRTTSPVAQPDLFTSVAPMAQHRTSGPIRKIVERAVPGVRVEDITIIPMKRLLRAFKVKLSDGGVLLLKLPPASPSNLLRSEQCLLQSEATVVEWLLEDACQRRSKDTRRLNDKSVGNRPERGASPRKSTGRPPSDVLSSSEDQLVSFLPTLIKHSPTSTETEPVFNLFEPTLGDSISSLKTPLTVAERKSIDFQKGRLMRRIANMKSPNGKFGRVATVLGQPQPPEGTRGPVPGAKVDLDGVGSWRKTFHLLLEGVLRDGEDMAVTISYELVRSTFHKFAYLLDAVTTSRLVVCDGDEDEIILVSRPEGTPKPKENHGTKVLVGESVKEAKPCLSPVGQPDESQRGSGGKETTAIKITGLRDWGNCMFGDPLFATVFSHPTPEFDRGFRQVHETHTIGGDDNNDDDGQRSPRGRQDTSIIEDPGNAQTRILLYECYHATASIVRQFYRPDADSSERELAARRRLVAALAKLERVSASAGAGSSVSDPAGKRPRRLSREDWPAKRPRGDTPTPKQATK